MYKDIHEEPRSATNEEIRRVIFTGYFELPIKSMISNMYNSL